MAIEAEGAALAPLTTMGVGGPAERLVEARTEAALLRAVRDADERGEPVLLIGGGSNLVIADSGFAGLAVLVRTSGITQQGNRLIAAAGQPWDALVARAVGQGLAGVECLSGIPGQVGATPIQNVGAYGQEVADVIVRVRAYDRGQRELRELTRRECGFSYRHSRFKLEPDRWVVTEVEFELQHSAASEAVRYAELARALGIAENSSAPLADVRAAVLGLRRGKGMVLDPTDPDTASCGSFFTNPILDRPAYEAIRARSGGDVPAFAEPDGRVKVPAAWLIDRAGYGRGYPAGGPARLSTKHPLAITNPGSASAADIVALARQIRDGVRDRFGVTLVNEPVLVGVEL